MVLSFCLCADVSFFIWLLLIFFSLSLSFASSSSLLSLLLSLCISFLLSCSVSGRLGENTSSSSTLSLEEICGAAALAVGKSLRAKCQLCRRQPLERGT